MFGNFTKAEVGDFKSFISKYCKTCITEGLCEEDACEFCCVNNAYTQVVTDLDKQNYKATLKINGFAELVITSESKDAAKSAALNEICDVDFGELKDIDSEIKDVVDNEDGTFAAHFHVWGYDYISVEAESENEAEWNAEGEGENRNYGELHDIDWEVIRVEVIEDEDMG